ncbi:MAG: magnesium transporter CorA family protein [Planctomycetota bacterium]
MQKGYRLAEGKLVEVTEGLAPIVTFTDPTEEERKYCVQELKIDEHTLASALDPDELSRVEFEPEHIAVIYSAPSTYMGRDRFTFKGGTAGAFLFKDKLVIVGLSSVPAFYAVQFTRIQTNAGLVLKLILGAVAHFREHLKSISMIADELQKEINTAMENRQLIHLFTLEKSLVYYLNFIHGNGVLLERLKHNAVKVGFSPEEIEILEDIMIENSQCIKQAEIYSNIIASLMDARASIVGNNLNVLIKTLNIITIALMGPTLVVSIFSMNVKLPGRPMESGAMFWMVLALATVSALVTFLIWWPHRRR